MSNYLSDNGVHVDRALSNMAVEAFNSSGDFIAGQLFPTVPVEKQSDGYYVIDPDSFLSIPDTKRERRTAPNRIEFKVSTDVFYAKNYALAADAAKEDLANADAALRIREGNTRLVVEGLLRDYERRVALQCTSISNVGSGVTLTGNNQWTDPVNSDPISDVRTAHTFIENRTGFHANAAFMDKDTHWTLRFHPVIRDYIKYTGAGPVPDDVIADVLDVERIVVARGIYNSAKEGAAGSRGKIWGDFFLLAKVDQMAASLRTATFGLGMRWTPEGFPAPFAVEKYDDPDPGKKVEICAAQYFQDEKIVAKDLAYLINDPV